QPFRTVARAAEVLVLPPARRYVGWVEHFSPERRLQLYTETFRQIVADSDPERLFSEAFMDSDAENWTDSMLSADVNLYLPDDLLVKIDRATMAHSLEARSPFLDHVLMEFVASLVPTFKLSGKQTKRLLKAVLRGLIPDTILDRPKMGFCAPV